MTLNLSSPRIVSVTNLAGCIVGTELAQRAFQHARNQKQDLGYSCFSYKISFY